MQPDRKKMLKRSRSVCIGFVASLLDFTVDSTFSIQAFSIEPVSSSPGGSGSSHCW
ncbi:hypothetical protein CKA32_001921 [Geitlerinema sp. FC II]|nr:hypothetical protein CKA32_001921 [Geitlerinema sp. FC II]